MTTSRLYALTLTSLMAFTAVYALITTISPAHAATHIVNPGESIQTAIDNATAGDTILISAGTYTESITLNKAVSLTGVSSDTTIINGPLNQRVISVAAGIDNSIVISGMTIQNGGRGISPTNGGGIYLNGSPQLNNLTIQHNTAISGAGIYAAEDIAIAFSVIQENKVGSGIVGQNDVIVIASQILSNTVIDGNGGGVFAAGSITVSRSTISGNNANASDRSDYYRYGWGGGLFARHNITVYFSQITHNISARDAGGLHSDHHNTVISSTISYNTTIDGASAVSAYSSTVILDSDISNNIGEDLIGALAAHTAIIENSKFSNNTSPFFGSAITADVLTLTNSLIESNKVVSPVTPYPFGSNAGTVLTSKGLISNTIFLSNTQAFGALNYWSGSYLSDPQLTIINSVFIDNISSGSGGGLYATARSENSGSINIINTVFADNHASEGNHIFIENIGILLEHVTIVTSTSSLNTAVYLSGTSTLTLTNSIVASHTTAVETNNGATANIDYSLLTSATPFSGTNITVGSNIITNTNPLFLDSVAHDYRLLAGSPAINAGIVSSVTTDIDGNTRPGPRSSLPDLGAYECDTITAESVTASDTAFWYPSQNRQSLDDTVSLSHCDPSDVVIIITEYHSYLPLITH